MQIAKCQLPIGASRRYVEGGGIYNFGRLTIINCTIAGNTATRWGGGIANSGELTIINSTIAGNSATELGGGFYNLGTLTVINSTVAGNSTSDQGGGFYNSSQLTVRNSTIAGNSANRGGGTFNRSLLTVINSTIAGNSASDQGGGFYNNLNGRLTVSNSTVADNTAITQGGGIYVLASTRMVPQNTILAENAAPAGPDVHGTVASQGHNLIGNCQEMSGWVETDILHVNPRLGPLQDNGGPTLTHALLPGSPALDAGDNTDASEFDQRGLSRVVADTIDIGAFEVQIGDATSFRLDAPAEVVSGVPFDVTLYALDDYGHVASGYKGTVAFSTTDKGTGVVLPAGYAFTADDQGMHTFAGETVLVTPGKQFLRAADEASGLYGEAVVTVTPGDSPEPRGGGPQAMLDGSLAVELVFTPIRRRIQPDWFWVTLAEQPDGQTEG